MNSKCIKIGYIVASTVNYGVAVYNYVVSDYMAMAFSFFVAIWLLLVGIFWLAK